MPPRAMRRAIVDGIMQYAGVSDHALVVPGVVGATMMLAGGLLVKRAKSPIDPGGDVGGRA